MKRGFVIAQVKAELGLLKDIKLVLLMELRDLPR